MTPENSLNIARANINDAELLTKLSITTFRDAFGASNRQEDMDKYITDEMNLERLTEELRDQGNIFFLARYNEIPVGYSKLRSVYIPDALRENNPIEIERLYVLKEYQSKKMGASIMKHCVDHAIKQGHDVIWLGVWEHNLGAIKFYNRHGFELFGAHSFFLGYDEQTDVLMRKTLRSSDL